MNSSAVLDVETLLNEAEREFICEGRSEFVFPVRRRKGMTDFYEALELELRDQSLFSVAEYRTVREGYVKLSRPARLRLTSEDLLKSRPYLRSLSREVEAWRADFAKLNIVDPGLRSAYREMTANPSLSRSCLEVLAYLIEHREAVRGLLPRQVPHSESSKLIGRENLLLRLYSLWRGEPATWRQFFRHFELLERPVEFRFFAPRCEFDGMKLVNFHGVVTSDSALRYRFTALSGTLIVENIETFFSEAERSVDRLVIWGGGWKAVLLRSLENSWPRPVLYWGDLDKEGYEIYGALKTSIPDLQPTLMDMTTINNYRRVAVKKEPFPGPYRAVHGLQGEYQEVCRLGLCIEQEKIHEPPYKRT
jgi:hypothetical protein